MKKTALLFTALALGACGRQKPPLSYNLTLKECFDRETDARYVFNPDDAVAHGSPRTGPQGRDSDDVYYTFPDLVTGQVKFMEADRFHALSCRDYPVTP